MTDGPDYDEMSFPLPLRRRRSLRLRYANIRKRGKRWGTGPNLQKVPVTLRKTETRPKPPTPRTTPSDLGLTVWSATNQLPKDRLGPWHVFRVPSSVFRLPVPEHSNAKPQAT